ncbi:MAG TPA: nuclear transport factor 2 family protein [Gemmatimonadaceae bacterium]|nr:nuclear transport factor 2 family protein [Gemmatimonadaceae bacterium]
MSAPDDVEAIARLHERWVSAVGTGDFDALTPLVTDDYEVWAHAADPIRGPAAVAAAMRAVLGSYRVEQRFEPVETVIAGEWAFQRGVERIIVTPMDGSAARTITQRALLILRRGGDGRWRYARGMTNGFPPHAS